MQAGCEIIYGSRSIRITWHAIHLKNFPCNMKVFTAHSAQEVDNSNINGPASYIVDNKNLSTAKRATIHS